MEAVEKQKIALGFIEGPARSRDVKTEPFLEDELVLDRIHRARVGRAQFDLLRRIASSPLLMRERGSGTRHVIEIALERQGIKRSSLQIVMELDSTEAIKSAVEAGLGIGFVSRWAIAKDLRLDSISRSSKWKDCASSANFLSRTPPVLSRKAWPLNSADFSSAAPVRKERRSARNGSTPAAHKNRK